MAIELYPGDIITRSFEEVSEGNLEKDEQIIFQLLREQESSDLETVTHQMRVARIAQLIASKMQLPWPTIKIVRLASLGHDIGKKEVPIEILYRKGPLSRIEKCIHVIEGYSLLDGIVSESIRDAVFQHHEGLDGSGYPRGLKGEDICIEARIIRVADEIHAGASRGPNPNPDLYLPKVKEIVKEMIDKPAPYDPKVVEACAQVILNDLGFRVD